MLSIGKLETEEGMLKSSPREGDPAILPRKISFHGSIRRDVLFAEKVVLF